MSETKNVTITRDHEWTKIDVSTCILSCSETIEYCQKATKPASSLIGHFLKPYDTISYVDSGLNLYVRGQSILVYTEV